MKSSVLAYLCLIFAQNIFAQNKRWELKESYPLRYHQIVDLSQQYFQNDKDQRDTSRIDKEIKRFNRWQWYWQGRITDIGDFPDLIEQNQIYKSLQFQTRSQNLNQVWTNISQTVADGGYNGMGRLTSVAFHPTDINTFYVGAPIGEFGKPQMEEALGLPLEILYLMSASATSPFTHIIQILFSLPLVTIKVGGITDSAFISPPMEGSPGTPLLNPRILPTKTLFLN